MALGVGRFSVSTRSEFVELLSLLSKTGNDNFRLEADEYMFSCEPAPSPIKNGVERCIGHLSPSNARLPLTHAESLFPELRTAYCRNTEGEKPKPDAAGKRHKSNSNSAPPAATARRSRVTTPARSQPHISGWEIAASIVTTMLIKIVMM